MTANKNNDDLPLHAVVFAGPNGSGKSSLIKELEESGLTTIGGLYPVPAYVGKSQKTEQIVRQADVIYLVCLEYPLPSLSSQHAHAIPEEGRPGFM